MSDISVVSRKMQATDTRLIQVSDNVEQADGTFVRAVRIYGDPIVNGGPTLMLEVLCTSDNKADLVVATPASGF